MTMTVIQAKDCVVFHSFLTFRSTLYKDKESLSEWRSHGDGELCGVVITTLA